MSKRKLVIFFVIAFAVFAASRGSQVRHAAAATATAPRQTMVVPAGQR